MELLPSEHWALLADAIIAALLVATIAYAAILERKLSALRAAKQEMAELIGRFTEATTRAESGLAGIRQTAEETGRELQRILDKGNSLADDLVFLVERGDAVAGRLEHGTAKGRGGARAEPPPAAKASSSPAAKAPAPPPAEDDATAGRERTPEQAALMAALRAMR